MKKKHLHTKKNPEMNTAVLIPGFFPNYLCCRLRHHDWKCEKYIFHTAICALHKSLDFGKGMVIIMIEKEFWKPGNMLYPIPAVMVSCGAIGERPNIITVAWAGTICSNPAMVSISVRKERYSYDLIKDSREFVINLVTKDLVKKADYCGVKSGREVDKFDVMKLTQLKGKQVSAPLIGESPVNIECVVKDILPLGTHDMFLAEVVSVAVDKKLMDKNGRFHLNQAELIVYSHGEYYGLGELLGKFGYSVKKK